MTKATNKIAIIGRAPRSRYLAPYGDESWQIWTCSPGNKIEGVSDYTDLPRWDKFFELHAKEFVESRVPGAWDWLMGFREKDKSKVVIREDLNLDNWANKFGHDYWTSTPAYMITYAIEYLANKKGEKCIGLWGCDFAHNTEYGYQKPCAEFWCGYAAGRGIKVIVPDECDMMQSGSRYGRTDATRFDKNLEARIKELEAHKQRVQAQFEEQRGQIAAMTGGATELTNLLQGGAGEIDGETRSLVDNRIVEIKNAMEQAHGNFEQLRSQHDVLVGSINEATYQRRLRGTATEGNGKDESDHGSKSALAGGSA